MHYKKELSLSASCFLLALLCSIIWLYAPDKNLADRIAPDILRFHVVANSNSREDQEIKLQVKSLILEELSTNPYLQTTLSKETLCRFLLSHKPQLESTINQYLQNAGSSHKAVLVLDNLYFPSKTYGDITLPCGNYDALQVSIGSGRGRNWWCVLYPRLCFVDATHAILPDSSKEQLKSALSDNDYGRLLDNREMNVKVRFHLLDTLRNAFFDK